MLPQPIVDDAAGADIGIISFGTNDDAIREARAWLSNDGIETDYLRVRALPLSDTVGEFIAGHKSVFIIENNFDGQLNQLIHMESTSDITHLRALKLGDGLPMTPSWIYENIREQEG